MKKIKLLDKKIVTLNSLKSDKNNLLKQNEENQNTSTQTNENTQQIVKVVQEKQLGFFGKMKRNVKDDFKRATYVEEGSVIQALKDLWRMLFPKK